MFNVKREQFKKVICIIVCIIFTILFVQPAWAASILSLSPSAIEVKEGQEFSVVVGINPGDERCHTVKLGLVYPANLVTIKSFNFAGGWMSVPKSGYDLIDNFKGTLIKTAGYPGGIAEPTTFGVISFRTAKAGQGVIEIEADSFVLNKESQNNFIGPVAKTAVIITKEAVAATAEEEFEPEEEIATTTEEMATTTEEMATTTTEKEEVITEEEEEKALFDVIIEPIAKEKRNLFPIIISVLLIIAILVAVSYIMYARKKKSLNNKEEEAEDNK